MNQSTESSGSHFKLLFEIAIRNLFSNFLNSVIGGIILVGTLFIVVGSSLLNSVDSAMSRSIIGSVAGHIQVYSVKSKDELALYNSFSSPDISEIKDFSKVKKALLSVDNVKTVVPMGVDGVNVTHGNTMDVALEKLRKFFNQVLSGDNSPQTREKIESSKSHVKQMVKVLQGDIEKLSIIASQSA